MYINENIERSARIHIHKSATSKYLAEILTWILKVAAKFGLKKLCS